jgi:hypothetical protein
MTEETMGSVSVVSIAAVVLDEERATVLAEKPWEGR